MLEEEKAEINKWLRLKWPEVFDEITSKKLKEKLKKDFEAKIVVEMDVYEHLQKRIDQYLYKRWPDIFIEEKFKEFKKDLESKYEDMHGKENRINARMIEAENRLKTFYDQALEKAVDSRAAFEVNFYDEKDKIVNEIIEILERRNPWWKFWNKKK